MQEYKEVNACLIPKLQWLKDHGMRYNNVYHQPLKAVVTIN